VVGYPRCLAIPAGDIRVVIAKVTIGNGITGNRNIAFAVLSDPFAEIRWLFALASSQHAGKQY
jgi:hypothetical protein